MLHGGRLGVGLRRGAPQARWMEQEVKLEPQLRVSAPLLAHGNGAREQSRTRSRPLLAHGRKIVIIITIVIVVIIIIIISIGIIIIIVVVRLKRLKPPGFSWRSTTTL